MEFKQLDNSQYASISEAVESLVKNYLNAVDSKKVNNLYELVLEQVEPALLEATIQREKYNQSRTAKTLGLSRGTTREMLKKYFGEKYCSIRGKD